MTTRERQLADLFVKMSNTHNPDLVDRFIGEDYIDHNDFVADGREANRQFWTAFFTGLPDVTVTMEDLRHRVVTARFVGMAPRSALPAVVWECTSPPPRGQQSTVKPTSIVIACADNGIGVDNLAWTTWTTTAAAGTGRVWEKNCVPNSATGTISYYPASVTLSRVADTSEGPLFTRLTAMYHSVGPQGRSIGQFQLPSPPE